MRKKILFRLILVLIPVLAIIILESVLRLSHYGTDLRLFKKSELYPNYYEINKDMGKRYFRSFDATSPTNDIFLIEKPDTCYRVFVLGCSTTRGFPYQTGTMFSRILYYRLQDAFPNKRIEVVNMALSAINSFSVADMMDEVLENKPDAILVYTGHNEYYGALGVGSVENGGNMMWLKNLQLSLVKFRTFQMMQKFVFWIGGKLGNDSGHAEGSLMERIVKEKSILYGSSVFNGGVEQFDANMTKVIKKAKNKNVPIILSEIVCNIKDQAPFKSQAADTLAAAIDVYNKATELEKQGKYAEAKALYYKSKDLDVIRFRAPEAFNGVIKNLGKEYQCPVVPMKAIFEQHSPNGLIGNNLMLEHLHPNIDGYFLMADAFFNTMKENKLIAEKWDTTRILSTNYYRQNWGFTELDSMVGDLKIKMLKAGWPFKPENEPNMFASTYKYNGLIDSMAFTYVTSDSIRIEDQHVFLSNVYGNIGENRLAFNEYYSIIKCYPHVTELYFNAVKFLISDKRYADALTLIKSIPDKDTSYFYDYMLGTLNIKLQNFELGVKHLNIARKLVHGKENELKILLPLHFAYENLKDTANEERIAKFIKVLDPDFGKTKAPVIDTDTKVKYLTNMALEQIKTGDLKKALAILAEATKIKETLLVTKMAGSILFQMKDPRAYQVFLKAYSRNPKDPEILNNLFILSLIQNNTDNAQKYLDEFKAVSVDLEKIKKLETYLTRKKKELGK